MKNSSPYTSAMPTVPSTSTAQISSDSASMMPNSVFRFVDQVHAAPGLLKSFREAILIVDLRNLQLFLTTWRASLTFAPHLANWSHRSREGFVMQARHLLVRHRPAGRGRASGGVWLRMALEQWPPYLYQQSNTGPAGLDWELAQAILKEAGCKLAPRPNCRPRAASACLNKASWT
jgi:hypothetical protein